MKRILLGYSLGLLTLLSCAGVNYKYYGLELSPQCFDQGTLLGKQGSSGWEDLPLSSCKPDEIKKGKCIVMTSDEFFAAKQETLQLRQALKDCQAGSAP